MKRIFAFIFLFLFLLTGIDVFGAKILFDYTKDERAGNADWVIDTNYPIPSPSNPTSESSWDGAISSWGYALYQEGHTCHTLTSSYGITYGDSNNPYDLSNYDVFVVCEPQDKFTSSEKTAILNFVQNGGGLFIVSDHNDSDRNNSGWDSPHIWNDLGTETYFGFHFGVSGDSNNNITYTSSRVSTDSNDPIIHGSHGTVSSFAFHGGTTITLNTGNNSTATGHIWYDSSHNYVMFATAEYGSGKVCAVSDSSPADDGTGYSGDNLYDGWNEADDKEAFLNGMEWLLENSCDSSDSTAPDWAASGIANLTVSPGNGVNALDWDNASDSENPDITYSVYRSTTSGFSPNSGNKIVSGLTDSLYTDSGLTNGTTYYYRISVENCVPLSRYNTDEAHGTPNSSGGGTYGNDLIISEVCDHQSNYQARYVEIYNPTANTVDLSNYVLNRYSNGGTTPSGFTFSGSINSGEAKVVAYSASAFNSEFGFDPDWTSGIITGNGDDVYELVNNGTPIDIYGEIGVDGTGQPWEYTDSVATRVSTVCSGTTTWTASEWTITSGTSSCSPKTHTCDCPGSGVGCDNTDTTAPVFSGGNSGISIADQENGGTLQISWNTATDTENPDSVEYALYRDTTSGFTPSSSNLINTGTATSYTDTGLTVGTTYYYIVQTYNCVPIQSNNTDQGMGVPTDPAQAPTLQTASPGDGQVSLSWTSVTGSDEYRIYYSTTDGGPYTLITSTTATNYTHTGLTNGTTYYYVIKNYDAEKLPTLSNYSNQKSATPTAGGSGSGGCATDLIISEYIEGSSNNKALEIYNGTGSAVDLSDYSIRIYSNGSTSPSTIPLNSVSLNDNSVFIIVNSGADASLLGLANQTSGSITFNGDDAVALYKESSDTNIDIIGQIGNDPGSYWGSDPITTKDHTLVRKSTITSGDTNGSDPFDPATEWDAYDKDTFTYLGSHTMDCGSSTCDNSDTTPPDWAISGISNITVTNSTSSSVDLSWDTATDVENNTNDIKYDLYRSQTSPVDTTTATLVVSELTTTNYTDNGLTSNQTYYYKVVAKNCVPLNRTASDEVNVTIPSAPLKQWTIMVYMNGDNNLESAAIEDFLEMSAVGSDTNMNIVVQLDRIDGNDTSYDDWTDTKRFYVTKNMTPTITNAVQDMGELNMGDGNTLVDFAKWAKDNYPAQHYLLIIWDHGDGWRSSNVVNGGVFKGASQDDTDGGDYIYFTSGTPGTLGEMGTAWQNIKNYYGQKLDIIGFDVCLDQMWENNAEAVPNFDYFVASEMSEWSDGWAYTTFLNQLASNNGNMTAVQLANSIVDAYANGENGSHGATQSAIDLSKVDTLTNTINDFAIALRQNLNNYGTEIQNARNNCFELETSDPYYHQIDLYDYCLKLEAQSIPQSLKDKSVAVRNAISASVTDNFADSGNDCHGIGIYFPRSANDYDSYYDSTLIAPTNNWDEFIQRLALSTCNSSDTTPPDWATSGISNITIVNSNSTSIELSWDTATDAENNTDPITYDLYRDTTSPVNTSTSTLVASDLNTTTYTNTGLNAGTTYYYRVVAKNCVPLSRLSSDEVTGITPSNGSDTHGNDIFISEVCDHQSNYKARYVEIYNPTANTIDLSNYVLNRYSNGNTTANGFSFSGTINSGEAKVVAYNTSEFNSEFGFDPDWTSGIITGNGDDVYELVNNGTPIDIYGVKGVDGSGEPWEYTDSVATRVASVCSGNTTWVASEWTITSGTSSCTPKNHTCDCPGGGGGCDTTDTTAPEFSGGSSGILAIDATTGGTINLSWNSASDNENNDSVQYALYRSTETPFTPNSSTLIDTGLTSTSYTNTGLTNGITYYYIVQTYNCAGLQTNNTDTSYAVPTDPAQAPTLQNATPGDGEVSLTWSSVAGSDEYRVYYSTQSGGPYTLITSTTATNYIHTGLTNGTTYYYTIRNYDAEKYPSLSDYSNELSATPTAGGNSMDISGWKLIQYNSAQTFTFPVDTSVDAGGYVIVARNADRSDFESFWGVTLGSNVTFINSGNKMPLINGGEYFELKNDSNVTIDGPTGYTLSSGQTAQRKNPGDNSTQESSWNTGTTSIANPGSGAGTPSNAGVVINEYSDSSDYNYEFVELYYDSTGASDNEPPIFSGLQSVTDNQLGGQLVLEWNSASDTSTPITYYIYQSTQAGGENFSSADYTTTDLSYTVKYLQNGITYYFVVRAADSKGNMEDNSVEKWGVPTSKFNDPSSGDVLINEFTAKGTEKVEIYNTSSSDTFNLCNLLFTNSTNSDNVYRVSGHSYIAPNEYIVFNPDYVELSNTGDTLSLKIDTNIIDQVVYGIYGGAPIAYSNLSTARVANTGNMANDWNRDPTPTYGSANDAPGVSLGSTVVINEYKVNAANDSYVLELYNPTDNDVDVTGWLFTDADNSASGIGTLSGTVPAHGYLVFTKDISTPMANVNISGDNIYLYDNNGVRVDQAADYGHTFDSSNTAQRVPNGTGGTNNGYNWTTSGFTEQEPTWNANNDGCDHSDSTPPDWATSGQSNITVSFDIDHVHIVWDAANDTENPSKIYYNIYRSTQSGFTPNSSNIIVTGTLSLSYDDNDAVKGNTNYYTIATYNCNNNTKYANDEDGIYVPNPPDPPILSVCAGGNGYVYLEWSSINGADYYNIYRSTISGGPYTNIDNTTSPNYTDNNVSNGTTYYYVVTTYDSDKDPTESGYSNEKYAFPDNCLPTGNTVLISEINIYPREGITNEDGEWIELYNPTASPISIVGWSLSDLGSDTVTIGASCPDVPAYGYLVLGATDNLTLNDNVNVDYVYCRGVGGPGCFALGNDGDEVILKDNTGNTVDMLVYDSSWFTQGYSITKVDMLACSNQKSSWGNETTQWNPPESGYGTPGSSNFPFGLYQAHASLLNKVDFSFTHEVDVSSANDITKYKLYPSTDPNAAVTLNSINIQTNNIDASLSNENLIPGIEYTLEIIGSIQDIYYHPVTDSHKKVTFVSPINLDNGTNPILFPEWSYDGQKIAYIVYDKTTDYSNLWIQQRDGSNKHQITANTDNVSHVGQFSFSPNDQYIIYTANANGYTQLRKVPVSGGSSTLMEPPSSTNWGRWSDPSWGTSTNQTDGIERVVCSISGELWVFNPATITNNSNSLIQLTELTTGNYHDTYAVSDKLLQPKWAPDNTKLTFVRRFAGDGVVESDIYIYNNVQTHIANKNPISSWSNADLIRITSYTKPCWSPSISVDGTQVSYVVDVNNLFNNVLFWNDPDGQFANANFDAYYENTNGDESGKELEANSYNEGFMKWAPAGGDQYIYTSRDNSGRYTLNIINHPMTLGFNKGGIIKINDYSYSSLIVYSSQNGIDEISMETPIILPPFNNIDYKYIGECRYFNYHGEDTEKINGQLSIHFMKAEIRNINPKTLVLLHYNTDKAQWEPIISSNVKLDKLGGSVSATVTSLGYYAIASYSKFENADNTIIIYPNPLHISDSANKISIESSYKLNSISIYTIAGEKLPISLDDFTLYSTSSSTRPNGYQLDTETMKKFSAGIYLIITKGNNNTDIIKFVMIK